VHQTGHEIKPYGHLVRMPISLAESACKESVDNLNQLLADTMTLRDMHKKHHWQVFGPTLIGRGSATRSATAAEASGS
jgi:starvation-inducible DNA-binding protein